MTRKLNVIPKIENYKWIKNQMNEDLKYRLEDRLKLTTFGRPLYERINVQIIITKECPYNCPFCLEKQYEITGKNDFNKQIESLIQILKEHPNARLTITGGEPSLYIDHIQNIINIFNENSNKTFITINTTGYNPKINDLPAKINLSVNKYIHPDLSLFPNSTYQTVFNNEEMNIQNIKDTINKVSKNSEIKDFSFRFLTDINTSDYPVNIWNDIQSDKEFNINTFRIGDFFVYTTFDYNNCHGRITLADMNHQQSNDYKNGYSNIIIHPDGKIGINWK